MNRIARCFRWLTAWLGGAPAAAGIVAGLLALMQIPALGQQPAPESKSESRSESEPEARVIEEIIVTGEYFESTLDETPGSVSVLGRSTMQGQEARHFDQVSSAVPNLNFAAGATRPRFFQIRGIGERHLYVQSVNYSVGVLADELDLTQFPAGAGLFDVRQVEVLRGSQGTRQGANAIAGLILLRSEDPSRDDWRGQIRYGIGNYGNSSVELGVGGPLSERVRVRVAGVQERSDGFMQNSTLDRDDVNGIDENAHRLKIHIDLSDDLQLRLMGQRAENSNNYDGFSLDNSRVSTADVLGRDDLDYFGRSWALEWNLPAVRIIRRTTYMRAETFYGYDEDWVYTDFCADYDCFSYGEGGARIPITPENQYFNTDFYERKYGGDTDELLLSSGEDGLIFAGTTRWLLGVYRSESFRSLSRNGAHFDAQYRSIYAPYRSWTDEASTAYFFEIQSRLGERARLIIGYRDADENTQYTDSDDLSLDLDDRLWGGRAVFEWSTPDGHRLFLQYARGYKRAGVNYDRVWLRPEERPYQAETLDNIELGLTANSADGRLRTRAVAFRMRRHNPQTSASLVFFWPNGAPAYVDTFANAESGHNLGFELELGWSIAPHLQLDASLGLLTTRYGALVFRDHIDTTGYSVEGRDQANAPSRTLQTSLIWDVPASADVVLETTLQHRGGFFVSDSNPQRIGSHSLMHLRATWFLSSGNTQMSVWVRNLLDEEYFIHGLYFGNDARDGYTAKGYLQHGEPRHFGLSIRTRFGDAL
ncbi:MAG: TonB-dependent receptor [Gammaproteobacteria bacterium AqS3]|nr:TonB-dependent receptor [Gammaproteobacteria bacterium AqS3]